MFLLSQFGTWYNDCLDIYPLLTKATTTAAIGLVGDAAAQFHEDRLGVIAAAGAGQKKETSSSRTAPGNNSTSTIHIKYNTRRGIANVANNLFLTAPIYHYGYEWLESLIPVYANDSSSSVAGNSLAALVQVLFDSIIFDAIFVFLMVLSSGAIEGYTNNNATASIAHHLRSMRTNLLTAVFASWKLNIFTIPVEFLLFRYLPLRLRVLGMNVIDLVWEAVMSFVIHDEISKVAAITSTSSSSSGGGSEEDEKILSSNETTPSLSSTPASTPASTPSSARLSVDEVDLDPMMLPPSMPCGRCKQKTS